MNEKKIDNSCEDGIEKSVPRDQRSTSLGKPRDAKRTVILGTDFLSHLHTHDIFLLSIRKEMTVQGGH